MWLVSGVNGGRGRDPSTALGMTVRGLGMIEEGDMIRFLEKSGGRIWKYGEYCVSSQAVTTNHRCIGHQSSMKCIVGNRFPWRALFVRMG